MALRGRRLRSTRNGDGGTDHGFGLTFQSAGWHRAVHFKQQCFFNLVERAAPGAAVLQIVPFGLRYRGDFEGIATRNGVSYGELVLEDRRRSVFHWEFLDPERLEAGRAAVLDAGSPPGGREVYAFWVNQDVVVPPAAFLGAVRGAAASPLNRRLLAG